MARGVPPHPSFTPVFPFGHGIGYTRFEYADLEVESQQQQMGKGRHPREDAQRERQTHAGSEAAATDRNNNHVKAILRLLQHFQRDRGLSRY